jgi:hypothetical protein
MNPPTYLHTNTLTPPHDPHPRRYSRGFGLRDNYHSVYFDSPPAFYLFHLAWEYITPLDRYTLVRTSKHMHKYAKLREQAATANILSLLEPRPPPDNSPIDQSRVHLMSCAFLRFNCDYGDMIRWLEGPYTDYHRDWDNTFEELEKVRHCTPAKGFPVPDYPRAFQACTQGVPLKGNYTSCLSSCFKRDSAPLSADLLKNEAAVDEQLRKEEKLSYHIILPRFLWRFFPGLFLSIFRIAYRWGDPKPRLCVDPSTKLSADDQGNVNSNIPNPGIDEDRNPTIHYGTAFERYLIWIWNLRISYPKEEILQMTDDISAAFHRVLYHPDMGPAFATVWRDFLVIPVSAIFGAKDSPANYMLRGELRSHFANFMEIPTEAFNLDLIQRLQLPDPPSEAEINNFAPAIADDIHRGISIDSEGRPERRQPVFVDDTGNAHIYNWFIHSAAASVYAAYVSYGHPSEDPSRPPCINPEKWMDRVFHHLVFLGYFIDTREMIVAWPLAKREKLKIFMDELLTEADAGRPCTPHSISKVLGLIRHAAPVAPMGVQRSLRLQFALNDLLAKAPHIQSLRRWYQRKQVRLNTTILQELRFLRTKISNELYDPFWCRPIGLMVPRSPTITVYTDASTKALGGWSPETELNHMWRITVDDLIAAGLQANMGWNNRQNFHEPDIDPNALHINILEFFAIFIELWICIRQIVAATNGPSEAHDSLAPAAQCPPGGHRLLARADNTSALSWLRYASRTKRPPIRRLARLLTSFLCHPSVVNLLCVQGKHIAGVANVEADHLSRFELSGSWAAIMAKCPELKNLRVCLLPPELLSLLIAVFSSEQTEEWFETATTSLWTIAPPTFVTGSSRPRGTTTSAAPRP